jgi:hypothetical protein
LTIYIWLHGQKKHKKVILPLNKIEELCCRKSFRSRRIVRICERKGTG